MRAWLKKMWCRYFHGGGDIRCDVNPYWQCRKCGRIVR